MTIGEICWRVKEIEHQLNRMEKTIMAAWADVKAMADKQSDLDAKVVSFIADMKTKIADLSAQIANLPAGPTADEMQGVVDELSKGADNLTAAITA